MRESFFSVSHRFSYKSAGITDKFGRTCQTGGNVKRFSKKSHTSMGGAVGRLSVTGQRLANSSPLWLWVLCLLFLFSTASAATVRIESAESLEVRNVTLPDGEEVRYFVFKGDPVILIIEGEEGDQTLEAQHVEIDFTNELVRIIGFGSVTTAEESFQGDDLIVDLTDETFTGEDVLIVTEAIDVLGVDANRVPGQIDVTGGTFSPCSRCEQEVQDFSFRADRLELYPGDRLVAFEVTIFIKKLPVFVLPLLVVPLGPPDRQPQFTIERGTQTERAEVFFEWPYVAGANALGSFSVTYYADVAHGQGSFLANGFLGGRPTTNYFGGGINHRFFTDTGAGEFNFLYVPSFIEYIGIEERTPVGKTRDEFTVRFRYDTAEELTDPDSEWDAPSINVLLERDDEANQRIFEYGVALSNRIDGIEGTFSVQGFFDLDDTDEVELPSYDSSGEPLQTFSRLELSPTQESFSVGPFSVSELVLDFGIFQDQTNPLNRSASAAPRVSAARLLTGYTADLEELNPWTGFSVSGRSAFVGQYYLPNQTTSDIERQIFWDTNLTLNQQFGDVGDFGVTFTRNIREGETPFLFDQQRSGNEVRLDADLDLTPAPWLDFSVSGGYVFELENRPDAVGFEPLNTNLTFFSNTDWVNLSFENSYDIREEDPGTLEIRFGLSNPDPDFDAELDFTFVDDLYPINERGQRDNETESTLELLFGVRPLATFDIASGYNFEPLPPDAGEARAFWKPFELGVTLGTPEQDDLIPGLRAAYTRDLNENVTEKVGFTFTAAVPPFEFTLEQDVDVQRAREERDSAQPGSSPWTSELGVTWQGVVNLEVTGYPVVPPDLLNIDINPRTLETYTIALEDDLDSEELAFRLAYQTTQDRQLNGVGGYQDSELEARLSVLGVTTPEVRFGVEFFSRLALRDDLQSRTYLEELNLTLASSFFDIVGVQGALAYDGNLNETDGTLSTSRLTIDEVAFTVKLFNQLYVSTVFDDVWNFTGTVEEESPFNFQPEFRLTWDRCCWALFATYDTEDGSASITLTTPGATQGFTQGLPENTDLALPRRPLPTNESETP